jgi:transcriptional regulator with XRE-family HTH domain
MWELVGRRLKGVRRSRKISVEDLAERIGKSSMTIYGWESGKYTPTVHDLYEICRILRVSSDYLIGLIEDPSRGIDV